MYKSGCVMSVIAQGDVLEEDDSKRVIMPFGTEYKVRLHNKNYDKYAVDLIVNGEQVARFILGAGEKADIERFIDDDMNKGNKFKFTSLNDFRVKDKNDMDNGIVEAHFYREKRKQPEKIVYFDYPAKKWNQPHDPYNPVFGATCDNFIGYCSTSNTMGTGMDGATVRGSESDQKFQEVSGYEFDSLATIIKIKIVNGELNIGQKYCSGCGKKRVDGAKFCGNCGNKLTN